jgi:N-acylglucosamine-6-phosphate 2-epimerase
VIDASTRDGLLARIRGRLIVSVQADAESPLNTPDAIALLARVSVLNGAAAVRVEGEDRLRAVRAGLESPIVGIIKRVHPGFAPYITSTRDEIACVAAAGAEIVAFDATARERADGSSVLDLVCAAHASGLVAMADCSTLEDARIAAAAGADIVASTLAGYTDETKGRPLPATDLVAAMRTLGVFVICEGGIGDPEAARAAFVAGADAIVVGTAITNVDALVRRFAAAAPEFAVEDATVRTFSI